jgi:proteic killer suppression protein
VVTKSFRDRATRRLWRERRTRSLPADVAQRAYDKLAQLDLAETLEDLRVPPGNRLEKLSGDREGQHSIRINRQYRVCFLWEDGDAYEVEVTDYH